MIPLCYHGVYPPNGTYISRSQPIIFSRNGCDTMGRYFRSKKTDNDGIDPNFVMAVFLGGGTHPPSPEIPTDAR